MWRVVAGVGKEGAHAHLRMEAQAQAAAVRELMPKMGTQVRSARNLKIGIRHRCGLRQQKVDYQGVRRKMENRTCDLDPCP